MKQIAILGATGSIGSSTLKVIQANPSEYQVFALAAATNVEAMVSLCRQWTPRFAVMHDQQAAEQLTIKLASLNLSTSVLSGQAGLCDVAQHPEVDAVMAAIVGGAGLLSTMAAAKAGKQILLANKESLVMSGQLLIDVASKTGAQILPVDSEHNAIFQSLPVDAQSKIGRCDLQASGVSKILLTGSGGPFRYSDVESLSTVTPEQAIAHPNWSMGPKISVDSATMMNKGLEYIEAKWLFSADKSQLDVIIHPQSVIHSMVQYVDGSVIAQMGEPDMCTPIAHTMAYPNRTPSTVSALDFTQVGELTFLTPDFSRYPCLQLAIDACFEGQHATTTLNACNEVAVDAFLNRKIGFTDIARVNQSVVEAVCATQSAHQLNDLESLLSLDKMVRKLAQEHVVKVV